ncbi:uncharacterized protein [Asterias amurensis]|uniref:uncharacterized protein n=1 Tax=Asterias amurensis TaxID=7602 RepID=UPI003AB264FB
MGMIHNQKGVFLVLLDLSAAFDTVNHNVLFNRLECEIGITGTALEWFKSYFSGRTTQVLIDNTYSASHDMLYGLPQGSIVGPKSFTIYTIPIGRIIKGNNPLYHIYADDIQIYTSFTPSDSSSIQSALQALTKCIVELKSWMTENMLKLNNNKTEFFVAASPHFNRLMPSVQLHIGDEIITPTKTVRNLGIVFDNLMSMSSQITSLSRSVSYHLRNITHAIQTFHWSLGDNDTVSISNENSCDAFKPLEGMFVPIKDVPDLNGVRFVPAPGVVLDSCAVSSDLKAPLILGEYNNSCITDPLFCTNGSFTWAVWMKIQPHNQSVMGLVNLISAGNYDSFKSGFNIWLSGDMLLCSANNNKERSSIVVNMTYLVDERSIQKGQWFHLACSFNFLSHGQIAMMYFNGLTVKNNSTPDWDEFLDMQIQYNINDNELDNYLRLGSYITPSLTDESLDLVIIDYSNLMVTDGILGPDTIQNLYACGSMDWDLELRSLVRVSKGVGPFTLKLYLQIKTGGVG